ncbi:Holliday junction branch migration protein RuvA [Alkaliphilus hydrothermalis]|uniref:Holliday junction branch migration complex subunit RuvA n=1 Tax=Alkaliphilus hydrothermalis TaxID=1482730 RepID=A0ABS2NLR4_9FIRM|nr:Holliday junction branch migration protein RuvA [Alkaliphilus hydrothermalis]MBM7613876.1 Holliday junction DNA helicase RuvA [Alkaliphilus hydrothermalis]
MFEYIKGNVAEILLDKIILETNGIGYRINSTMNSAGQVKKGDFAQIFTYMVVREDEISLYGFTSRRELEYFKLLISVSKIGPKVAAAILSTYSPEKLGACIVNKDINSISKAPGVGKKTAERIVLELKDKVKETPLETMGMGLMVAEVDCKPDHEVLEALMALGYTKVEGEKAIKAVYTETASAEELIKKALKWLVR